MRVIFLSPKKELRYDILIIDDTAKSHPGKHKWFCCRSIGSFGVLFILNSGIQKGFPVAQESLFK